ncbi:MAG TPA: arginine--tRNA ligase [Clostridia bacterium]|nr:arginine--tRNA ligase [Clostridiales bacterium]HZK46028.1 arginine--tRNA ligase [Clostridia bacterium]
MDARTDIAKAIAAITDIDEAELSSYIEIPPDRSMGDYAFPCFRLAKAMRKAPPAIAEELRAGITLPSSITKAEVKGGYLNFFEDRAGAASATIKRVLAEGENYGHSDEGSGKNVCVEFSSINIAKPFHIGHLPSTAIGNSLNRIYKALGYNTIAINHLGDWGTQFGKMIVAYKKWGGGKPIEESTVRELVKLYVRFHEEAEKDESLNDEARAWFRKIEQGDSEAVDLWQRMKTLTLKEVGEVYKLLGVEFDSYAGESFYEDKMQAVIDELDAKGLLKTDKGAKIVDLSEYNMPPCIIVKSDGATLYATRDLAAAIYRKKTYDFVKSIYVVAYQQNLHFQQFFKVLELMGYDWVKDCVHVNFGMVSMEEGTLSTRHGNVVYLEDVLNASIEKTLEIIKEKSPDLEDKEAAARAVGVGAVVWGILYNSRIKDTSFSWKKMLNFDGETGPYAQYTHARCCSVLRKAGGYDEADIDCTLLSGEAETALVKAIAAFPDTVKAAAEKYEPYLIARAAIEICSRFNKFYYDCRIMDDDMHIRNTRLALTDAARICIKNALYLVGLEAPERM